MPKLQRCSFGQYLLAPCDAISALVDSLLSAVLYLVSCDAHGSPQLQGQFSVPRRSHTEPHEFYVAGVRWLEPVHIVQPIRINGEIGQSWLTRITFKSVSLL